MTDRADGPPTGKQLAALSLATLGVVYGDIGTSPLYALRESFSELYGLALTEANVLGVLSLIFWSLIIVISVKYLAFVMRANNRGEGGIMALTALVAPSREGARRGRYALVLLGLFGAALLYGDSMITPAISVLSAVEGLEVATPVFRPYIVPITIGILVALFAAQRRGTAGIGKVFGPVTLSWFFVLSLLGVRQILRRPTVLAALNPLHAARFFLINGAVGFLVLGSVFLVVTGGEALYADMGHFGVRPIRWTWFGLVLPALLLNYFGQGALLLADPGALANPFFLMAPEWALYPLVGLATAATVIASQAVISGAFSLTRQAVQLGYLPRTEIRQTSPSQIGQIYIPSVNWLLLVACVGLVLGFGSSSALAAAYGVGVTTDMVFTTILFSVVAFRIWKWSAWGVAGLCGLFLLVDLAFWGANLPKIPDGGWFPLVVAAGIFTVMTTWKKGRTVLRERLTRRLLPIDAFLAESGIHELVRVPGTAVFMSSDPDATPPALLHNIKHNHCLHERVVLVTVETEEIPRVPESERVKARPLGNGFFRVLIRYGFVESPDVPRALSQVDCPGLEFPPMETTYFLGREKVISTERRSMRPRWREKLFALMSKNARDATSFFELPANRVVEMGAQVEI
jgi:KUP system potassium uptake protein